MLAKTVIDKSTDEKMQRLKHTLALRFLHNISKRMRWLHDNLSVDRQLLERIPPNEKIKFVDLVLWRKGKHVLSIQQGKFCIFQSYLWVECQHCGMMLLPREVPQFAQTEFCWRCGTLLSADLAYDRMVASWP